MRRQRRIPKSGDRFSVKIMRKQDNEMMVRSNRIGLSSRRLSNGF
jgi:hypothetical protein